jgi:replication fork protection complex subunit Csm3/Swi3
MAATSAKARIVPSDDELDNILDGIAEDRDNSRPSGVQPKSTLASKGSGTASDGLGIDEEIIITKQRIPIPKLDDNRLLSDPGIPRLQRISKERLRFKGKGHEVRSYLKRLNLPANDVTVRRHCPHAEHVPIVARRPLSTCEVRRCAHNN